MATESNDDSDDDYEYNNSDDDNEYYHSDDEMSIELHIPSAAIPITALPEDVCLRCNEENHAPIRDCSLVASWRQVAHAVALVVPPNLIKACMEHKIREVARAHGFTYDETISILRRYNWRYTVAAQQHEHSNRALALTWHDLRKLDEVEAAQPDLRDTWRNVCVLPSQQILCTICYETFAQDGNEIVGLDACKHLFCRGCWNDYLCIQMQGPGSLMTECPHHACAELVPREFLARLYPGGLETFDKHLLDSFVAAHRRTLRYCPGPNCNRIVVEKQGNKTFSAPSVVQCSYCQTNFCLWCLQAPHKDATCLWNAEQDYLGQMKRCPSCSQIIEKNGGCDYMTCAQCRHEFCWRCMQGTKRGHNCVFRTNWDRPRDGLEGAIGFAYLFSALFMPKTNHLDEAKDHFNCHEWVTQQVAKFEQYQSKYRTHDRDQTAGQRELLEDRILNFTKYSGVEADASFIVDANLTLVAARRLLKYSFVNVFALESCNITPKQLKFDLFVFQLEQLERVTEKLSDLANDPTTLDDRVAIIDKIHTLRKLMVAWNSEIGAF